MAHEQRLFNVDELSGYLSLPKSTIYTWVSTKKLPSLTIVRLGRALRFDKTEVDRWIDAGKRST